MGDWTAEFFCALQGCGNFGNLDEAEMHGYVTKLTLNLSPGSRSAVIVYCLQRLRHAERKAIFVSVVADADDTKRRHVKRRL